MVSSTGLTELPEGFIRQQDLSDPNDVSLPGPNRKEKAALSSQGLAELPEGFIPESRMPAFPDRKAKSYDPFRDDPLPFGPGDIMMRLPGDPYKVEPLFESFREEGPEALGGEAGSLGGAYVGSLFGPVGTVIGAIVGAGYGGATARSIQQDVAEMKGAEPMNTAGRVGMMGGAFRRQAGAELFGRATGGIIGRAVKPFRKSLIKPTPFSAHQLDEIARAHGAHLTIGQLTDSWLADTAETLAEASIFGGRHLKKFKLKAQPEMVRSFASSIIDEFISKAERAGANAFPANALEPRAIGELLEGALSKNRTAHRSVVSGMYRQLNNMTKGAATIDYRPVKELAKEMYEKAAKSKGLGSSQGITNMTKKVMKWDDFETDFMVAHGMKSDIGKEASKFQGMYNVKDAKVGEAANKLANAARDAMRKAAFKHSDEALNLLENADYLWKEGAETFDNEIIKGLVRTAVEKGEPEKLLPTIFQPGNISRIKAVKKALNVSPGKESAEWVALKAAYVDKILLRDRFIKLPGSDIPNLYYEMGTEAWKEIFDPDQIAVLSALSRVSSLVGGKASRELATGGTILMPLIQAGGIGLMFKKGLKAAASTIFIAPEVVAQMITRPGTSKWVLRGIETPLGETPIPSQGGSALVTRIAEMVARAEADAKKRQASHSAFPERQPLFGSPYEVSQMGP